MVTESAVALIDKQDWLEPLGEKLAPAVADLYKAGGTGGIAVRDFLHGVWLGHPLHPALTDIPVGAWTAAAVLDGIEAASGNETAGRGADIAIAVGLAGAVGAAVTGITDWHHTTGKSQKLGLMHGMLNLGATLLYASSLIARKKKKRRLGHTLAFLGYTIAGISADIGGHLVFGEQIGVDHTAGGEYPEKFTPAIHADDLQEGKPVRADVNGERILLCRHEGKILAIAEVCSHLGGPLAEGDVEGDCVRCPWHGSLFSMETGEVMEGPSTYNQPVFETRIRKGEVEIRRKSTEGAKTK